MTAMSKVVSLLAISAALTLSGSPIFAKSGGPSQVKTSGTSAAPSGPGANDSTSKRRGGAGGGCGHACPPPPRPGHTQPACRGGHMGPNGVMVQCD
jgi:hypothetical protein